MARFIVGLRAVQHPYCSACELCSPSQRVHILRSLLRSVGVCCSHRSTYSSAVCRRCFADEIGGIRCIDFVDRGDRMQVLNFAEQPFDSYFSGNTVQICPVGALTASQYRFRARPWDLATVETSCTTCSVQCRGALQSSSNRLVRLLGVDSEPVNHGWLCDKGRYGIEWVHSERAGARAARCATAASSSRCRGPRRSTPRPTIARQGASAARPRCDRGARRCARHQRRRVRVGAAREGRDRHRQRRRAARRRPARRSRARPAARRDRRLDRAAAIVLLGPDLEEELPVLHLRLRRAAVELGVPLVDLAPALAHELTSRHAPGESVGRRTAVSPASALGARGARRDQRAADGARDRPGRGRARPRHRSPSRRRRRCGAAAALRRAARRAVPLRAAARQRARRARARARAGFLPGRVALDAGRDVVHRRVGRGARRARARRRGHPAGRGRRQDPRARALGCRSDRRLPRRHARARARSTRCRHDHRGRRASCPSRSQRADVVPARARSGARRPARSPTSKAGCSGSAARSRPKAPRWTTGASRASSRCASAPTSISSTVDEVTDEIARGRARVRGRDADVAAPRPRRRGAAGRRAPRRDRAARRRARRSSPTTARAPRGTRSRSRASADRGTDGCDRRGRADDRSRRRRRARRRRAASLRAARRAATLGPHVRTRTCRRRDAYALRLVAGRTLYDGGRMVTSSPLARSGSSREPRAARAARATSPASASTRGDQVKVTSTRASLELVACTSTPACPAGVARLDFSADAPGAAELDRRRAARHRPAGGDACGERARCSRSIPLLHGPRQLVGVRRRR